MITIDGPVYFEWLHIDYGDPVSHRLEGVLVSGPELTAKVLITVALLGIAAWMYLKLRKSDPVERPEREGEA